LVWISRKGSFSSWRQLL